MEIEKYKVIYSLKNISHESAVLGQQDLFLKAISKLFNTEIVANNGNIYVEDLTHSEEIKILFYVLESCAEQNVTISDNDFYSILLNTDASNYLQIANLFTKRDILYTTLSGKAIYPRTINQKIYIKAMEENDIVFAIGQAGTGKTYLGALFALNLLKSGRVRKIILARPIVEAGEKLGFLPGDFKEKIDPYLIPLYDCFNDFLGKDVVDKMIEKGTLEIAPLAYMRGRTLEGAAIVLDEAQNTTLVQMKMFLTRLGNNSKMIITGDISQIDLPLSRHSGLIQATKILENIKGIKIVRFTKSDVMRHPLVYKIIERYEANENED